MMQAYIKTYGCTLNQADSDIMESILQKSGIGISRSMDSSDVVIINTCTVKKPTEQRILDQLKKLEKEKRRIVVTGCMAGANSGIIEKYAPSASIVSTGNMQGISEIVNAAHQGRKVTENSYTRTDRLLFFNPKESVIAKVPVADGCLSSCSFCETKFARGPLNSFSEDLILNAIANSARIGAKEIQLTSQDMGAYGADRRTNIALLMKKISLIDGGFRVRIGMLNPEHLPKYFDEFIEAMHSDRFYKFVHLPVQSGSNAVLREMRRMYNIEQFSDYVDRLRKAIPGITVETDVIVGYPTETESDFDASLEFVKSVKPDVTNISKFSKRHNATASKLKGISTEEMVRRSLEMSRTVRAVQKGINDRFIDMNIDTLITENASKSMNGRSNSYKQVVINEPKGKVVGDRVDAKIYAVSSNVLYGKLN